MKKLIAAVAAGLTLTAAQALAADTASASRIGDRIGAPSGEASDLAGGVPLAVLAAAGIVTVFIITTDNDEAKTDFPASD